MAKELKDSGIPWIGEIPKHWGIIRTKNVFTQGKELVGEKSSSTQLLSLTTKGIKEVEIGSTSGKVPDSYDTYQLVKKDNMVMCLFDLDCSAVFSGLSPYEGMISPAYKVLTVKEGFKPKFYDYWFNYIFDGRKYMFLSKNIRYSLTYDEFASLGIVKPPILEQKAIAEFLDRKCGEIDELIALQDRMIDELKAYKQSVITEAVTRGLNPDAPLRDSGIEWLGQIPQHWKTIRLKEGFRLRTGTTPKDFEKGLDSDSLINWFTPSDIAEMNCELNKSERYLSKDVINKDGILLNPIGTLIFVGIGASAGKIGYSLIESYSNQQITNLIPNENKIVGKYVYYYLIADRKRIRDNAFFTTLPIINNSYLSTIKILTPPLSEQQEIAEFLDKKCEEIDSLIALKQTKIEQLKEYKKSIIYEYVTGKKQLEINEI